MKLSPVVVKIATFKMVIQEDEFGHLWVPSESLMEMFGYPSLGDLIDTLYSEDFRKFTGEGHNFLTAWTGSNSGLYFDETVIKHLLRFELNRCNETLIGYLTNFLTTVVEVDG